MIKFNLHPDTVYSILVIVFYLYLFFCLWLTTSLQFYPWRIERFHWQKYVWYRRLVSKQRRYFFVRYRRVLWRYCQMPNFGQRRKHKRQKKWYLCIQTMKCVPTYRNARHKKIIKFQRPNSEQRNKTRKWMFSLNNDIQIVNIDFKFIICCSVFAKLLWKSNVLIIFFSFQMIAFCLLVLISSVKGNQNNPHNVLINEIAATDVIGKSQYIEISRYDSEHEISLKGNKTSCISNFAIWLQYVFL